ncbi:MAG TPA: YjfB family protein [Mobilitalea sp.]|nr:YjfB family protein [Mobilitalea sp.]
MEISSLPTTTNRPVNLTDVSMALLVKNLDTIEVAGQSMIKMMEMSVQPNLGGNIDYQA